MGLTTEQKIKNIFRQTCVAVTKLGMSHSILSQKKDWVEESTSAFAHTMWDAIHKNGGNNELQTSILGTMEMSTLRDGIVTVFSLLAWPNTSANEVLSRYAALGLLAAKDGKVIKFDNFVDSMDDMRNYVCKFKNRVDLYDCLLEHFEVIDDIDNSGMLRNESNSSVASGMAIEITEEKPAATAADAKATLEEYINSKYTEGGAAAVLEGILDALKVIPSATVNEQPLQSLFLAVTGSMARPHQIDFTLANLANDYSKNNRRYL